MGRLETFRMARTAQAPVETASSSSTLSCMKRNGEGNMSLTSTPEVVEFHYEEFNEGTAITYSNGTFTVHETGVYELGCVLTSNSAGQRAQMSADVVVNGSALGLLRGTTYIRNSGSSWDYWPMEIATTPYKLNAGDTLQITAFVVSANNYGASGSLATTLHKDKSSIWISKK